MFTQFAALLFLLGLPALAQPSADSLQNPTRILQAAREASLNVRTAQYTAVYKKQDAPEDEQLVLVADVWLERVPSDPFGAIVRMDLSDTLSNDFRSVQVAYDGNDATAMSSVQKSAFKETHRYLSGNIVGRLVEETSLVEDDPFGGLMRSKGELAYDGIETVGGVSCHVITVSYPDGELFSESTDRYFIGQTDHLLRRVESSTVFNTKRRTWSFTLRDLTINASIPASRFVLDIPDGYDVTDRRTPTKRPDPLGPGTPAPAWTLPDSTGAPVSLRDFRGQHVVLDFWGTWCPPCLQAMPHIQDLHERFASDAVAVVAVSAREPEWADPVQFVRRRGFTYTVLLDGTSVAEEYRVSAFPAMFVIGPDGAVLRHWEGYNAQIIEEVKAFLEMALRDSTTEGQP
jgi:peroxiredoxin/outer membrane lipoprotein-sorting protein